MKKLLWISAIAVLATGCAEREDPSEVAAAQASGASSDPRPDLAPVAIGESGPEDEMSWQFSADGDDVTAGYGEADNDPQLVLSCDGTTREIIFTRSADVAAGAIDMRVGTGSQIKVIPADATDATPAQVIGRLAANDSVLVAVGASDSMSIQIGDGETLIVPVGDAFTQVLQSCG